MDEISQSILDAIRRSLVCGGHLMRISNGAVRVVDQFMADGFEWWYIVTRPEIFSLKLLDAALLLSGHRGKRVNGGSDFHIAWELRDCYRSSVIDIAPDAGIEFTWASVMAWIVQKCAEFDLCLACGEDITHTPTIDPGGVICLACGSQRTADE